MYLAFEDIEKKEKILRLFILIFLFNCIFIIIRDHTKNYGIDGLMSIINIEKEKGILELSGSNNSKYTKDKEY